LSHLRSTLRVRGSFPSATKLSLALPPGRNLAPAKLLTSNVICAAR
jgi:hypothetical protein